MKKIIIMLIALWITHANAQTTSTCWKDTNTITSNWNGYPTTSTNKWNWTNNVPNIFYTKSNTYSSGGFSYANGVTFDLPYFCTGAPGSAHCSNPNITHFHQMPIADLDIYPEDGWEVLIKDFGGENLIPGQQCPVSDAIDYPYFILYNRHNGKMKTFFLIPAEQHQNGAEITYEFENYKTSLYAHIAPATKSIEEFDPTLIYRTPSFYADGAYYWVYSEIQTYYDPCTCFDPRNPPQPYYPSQMKITLKLNLTTQVDLMVEGTIAQQIIDPATSGRAVPNNNRLISLFQTATDGYNAGMEAYKSWEKYSSQATSYLNMLNQDYKMKMIREFWEKDNPLLDNSLVSDATKQTYFNNFLNSPDAFKELLGISLSSPVVDELTSLATVVPYVGTALGMIDFFVNGGKQVDNTANVAPPMNFNVNLKIKGQNYTPQPKAPVIFNTPGASTNTGQYRPHYNNTLGVFGVLKAPHLGYYEYVPNNSGTFRNVHDGQTETAQITLFDNDPHPKFRQYLIKDDLKYVVNPHAGVEVISIDAALVLEYTNNVMQQHRYFSSQCNSLSDPKCAMYSKYKCYLPVVNEDLAILKDRPLYEKVEKSGMELDYVETDFMNMSSTKKMRIRTPYVPLNCLGNLSFYLHVPEAAYDQNCRPKVMVKLYVKMRRKGLPQSEPITEVVTVELPDAVQQATPFPTHDVFTYDWELVSNLSKVNFLYYNVKNFMSAHANPFYENPKMKVFKLGDVINSDVYAWQTVKILDGTIISPGVHIRAGEEIIVGSNVTIAPDATLETIGYFEGCAGDVTWFQATDDEINTVCTSGPHKALTLLKPDNPDRGPENIDSGFSFDVFPNPAKNDFFIAYDLQQDEVISIAIYDITGKKVLEPIVQQKQVKSTYKIDIRDHLLSPGVYFIKVLKGQELYYNKIMIAN